MVNEKNTKSEELNNDAKLSINFMSGRYATIFWDSIHAMSESAETVENFGKLIGILLEEGKDKEAMLLIRSLYDLMGMVFPEEISLIEKDDNTRIYFINEFLLDCEDLLLEYKDE
jgi:hypothetical protein